MSRNPSNPRYRGRTARVTKTPDEDPREDTEEDDGVVSPTYSVRDGVQVVNVNFDGTLTCENVEYWNGERPDVDEEVAQWVCEQYHSGNIVIVWTARPWSEANKIAAHLTEWEIPYHGIRCEKGAADLYVDDKMIHEATIGVRPNE